MLDSMPAKLSNLDFHQDSQLPFTPLIPSRHLSRLIYPTPFLIFLENLFARCPDGDTEKLSLPETGCSDRPRGVYEPAPLP
jgi:hypothetical protein